MLQMKDKNRALVFRNSTVITNGNAHAYLVFR